MPAILLRHSGTMADARPAVTPWPLRLRQFYPFAIFTASAWPCSSNFFTRAAVEASL
jgi:hypothetical protein